MAWLSRGGVKGGDGGGFGGVAVVTGSCGSESSIDASSDGAVRVLLVVSVSVFYISGAGGRYNYYGVDGREVKSRVLTLLRI